MVSESHLSKVWDIGYTGVEITTKQAVDVAINIAEAALRHWKVDDIAELTPKRRQNLLAAVDRTLKALGVETIARDWWVTHDWQEIDERPEMDRIVVA